MRKKILFTAGGTGGHILPTVSLVNFFAKNYDMVLVSDSRAKKYFKLNKKIKIYTINTDTPYKKNIIRKRSLGRPTTHHHQALSQPPAQAHSRIAPLPLLLPLLLAALGVRLV